MLRENFKEFMPRPSTTAATSLIDNRFISPIVNLEEESAEIGNTTTIDDELMVVENEKVVAKSSTNLKSRTHSPSPIRRVVTTISTDSAASDYGSFDDDDDDNDDIDNDITPFLVAIREEFRDAVENLHKTPIDDNEERCEMITKLLLVVFENVS